MAASSWQTTILSKCPKCLQNVLKLLQDSQFSFMRHISVQFCHQSFEYVQIFQLFSLLHGNLQKGNEFQKLASQNAIAWISGHLVTNTIQRDCNRNILFFFIIFPQVTNYTRILTVSSVRYHFKAKYIYMHFNYKFFVYDSSFCIM